MVDVPIALISTEDLAADFVWLKRAPGFTAVRRPTQDQTVPVDLTPYTLAVAVYTDRNTVQPVTSLAIVKVDAPNGRMQITAPEASITLLKGKTLHYHVMATLAGVTRQIFGGPFTVTAA
jgi:hypothetical protein